MTGSVTPPGQSVTMKSHPSFLTDRFDHALAYASRIHRLQTRKGSRIPYISHLLGACAVALEHGADEDQAIAALLHDAVKDQGGAQRLAEIERLYGAHVARIVDDCTDSGREPRPPWRERKEDYLAGLAAKPVASLQVSLADKIQNASAIVADLHMQGQRVWDRFTGGRDGSLWYYRALADEFTRQIPGTGSRRLSRLVIEMEDLSR
ncbi:HD domain-containing protein [Pseudopontixanthobacter vadosimaris]|uniref:HD domain-containing protein n=1 Tax=Pseudopontixanthobacter vadosimaris TaxID=2726450 RepID=UPI001F10559A|nr:HD domain-containing protein [Pseudopontixanthobacter vadosimaris]